MVKVGRSGSTRLAISVEDDNTSAIQTAPIHCLKFDVLAALLGRPSGHAHTTVLLKFESCFGIQGRYGGVASYRISRAANNMSMRTFAGELREQGFIFISMSPGHVASDMGSAGGRQAPLTVDQSVSGMLDVIAGLTKEDNGTFRQYDGATLPW